MDLATIVGSLVRNGGTALAAYLAGKGMFTSADEQGMIVAAAVALGGIAWSLFQKYMASKKLAAAVAAPAGQAS